MSDRRDEKIRCDACPVMCYIADGNSGACDRYANHDGQIVRLDPLTILDRRMAAGDSRITSPRRMPSIPAALSPARSGDLVCRRRQYCRKS